MKTYLWKGSIPALCALGLAWGGCATATTVVSEATGTGGSSDTTGETSTASATSASSSAGAGGCVMAIDCASINDACNLGTCVNGACQKMPSNDLASCDDGLFCTTNDTCQMGVCVGGTPTSCPGTDVCHLGSCDEAAHACKAVVGNDGAQCDDQDPCTGTGVCVTGACTKGQQKDCSVFNDQCHVGMCDAATGCKPVPANEGLSCDDSLFCSIGDTCKGGLCVGAPNTCAAPGDVCLVGQCSEQQKSCVAAPGPNGIPCDDKNTCTVSEACNSGLCSGGQPANNGGTCDDGKACTANDSCAGGVCAGTAIVQCVNNDGCCPAGCTNAVDNDCNCSVNLALTATASISSGGAGSPYSPSEMNNGINKNTCQWAWVDDNTGPTGAWIEYQWPQPVTIGSFYIETENGLISGPPCNNGLGRNVRSGTVQYWSNNAWATSTTFANKNGDVQIDLPQAVTTTRLRVFDLTTDPGNGNSIIYEWHVYGGTACVPPP